MAEPIHPSSESNRPPRLSSWWIGLSREDFSREVAARDDQWQKKAIGPLDYVGQNLRDTWDF